MGKILRFSAGNPGFAGRAGSTSREPFATRGARRMSYTRCWTIARPGFPKKEKVCTLPPVGAPGVNRWAHRRGGRSKDPEKVRVALELLAAGNTRPQIAERLGVSRTTVDNWLRPKVPERVPVEPEVVTPVLALELRPGGNFGPVRRWWCPRLNQCELDFIEKHGSAQGACPADCPGPRLA